MSDLLTGKTALITGAANGFGAACARLFQENGANVVVADVDATNCQALSDELGDRALGYKLDVTDSQNFQKCIEKTVLEFGQLDILVNNAGITRDALIMRMSEESWDKVIDINLKGAFNGIKSVSRQMMKQRSGKIINITSIVGLTGNVGQANYAASKAGLIGLSKSASKELASRGINVNCIAPGYINTEMTDQLSAKVKENFNKQIPLGRIGKPEEIASTALFLASEHASYITGQTITVDGGMV